MKKYKQLVVVYTTDITVWCVLVWLLNVLSGKLILAVAGLFHMGLDGGKCTC